MPTDNALGKLLKSECIYLGLEAENAACALHVLLEKIVSGGFLALACQDHFKDLLLARESQVSTGIGSGVAIPHAFSQQIKTPIVAFARFDNGVDFSSMDNAPVFFVLLFLIPESQRSCHLQVLASVARVFSPCSVRKALEKAQSPAMILDILSSTPL